MQRSEKGTITLRIGNSGSFLAAAATKLVTQVTYENKSTVGRCIDPPLIDVNVIYEKMRIQ